VRIAQVRAFMVVGVLLIIAVTTCWYAIANDSQTSAGRKNCKTGDVPVNIELPQNKDVNVKVLNATDSQGLATSAADSLKEYGFHVVDTGTSKRHDVKNVELRYGPKMVAGGHLLRAFFVAADYTFQLDNDADYVEITLGQAFQQVNTESDARNSLSVLGRPKAPEGTCPIT
jgi:hypothetical protein